MPTSPDKLEFGWAAVRSVRQRADSWSIRLPGTGGFRLRADDFSPEQAEEWQAYLAARELVRS